MSERIIVYTDGGARGNPGPAGSGAVVADESGTILKRAHKALGVATNNVAEYHGVILAFDTLEKMFGEKELSSMDIEVRMDSELVVRQMNGVYKVKNPDLKLLFADISSARLSTFPNVRFVHIPREKNKEADRESNLAMDVSERMKS